jgi:hypothetical protein
MPQTQENRRLEAPNNLINQIPRHGSDQLDP